MRRRTYCFRVLLKRVGMLIELLMEKRVKVKLCELVPNVVVLLGSLSKRLKVNFIIDLREDGLDGRLETQRWET